MIEKKMYLNQLKDIWRIIALYEKLIKRQNKRRLKWIKNELSPPIKLKADSNLFELLVAFESLLIDKNELDLIAQVYKQALCWTDNEKAEMLKPNWIKLSDTEEYDYTSYIEACEDLGIPDLIQLANL